MFFSCSGNEIHTSLLTYLQRRFDDAGEFGTLFSYCDGKTVSSEQAELIHLQIQLEMLKRLGERFLANPFICGLVASREMLGTVFRGRVCTEVTFPPLALPGYGETWEHMIKEVMHARRLALSRLNLAMDERFHFLDGRVFMVPLSILVLQAMARSEEKLMKSVPRIIKKTPANPKCKKLWGDVYNVCLHSYPDISKALIRQGYIGEDCISDDWGRVAPMTLYMSLNTLIRDAVIKDNDDFIRRLDKKKVMRCTDDHRNTVLHLCAIYDSRKNYRICVHRERNFTILFIDCK